MKKPLKIVLIIVACIFVFALLGGIFAFVATANTANAEEYTLGTDSIKSIKAVVERRQVTSVSNQISNGVTTNKITYKSDTIQSDLLKYVQYLRNEAGFSLTKDMNLSIIPSTVSLVKASNESGKIILITIDYNSFEYTITIQKGQGTLTLY